MEWDYVSELWPPMGLMSPLPRYMNMESHGGMILTGESRRTRRKKCPTATVSTTNPTQIKPRANVGLHTERPATNRLSYGTALSISFGFAGAYSPGWTFGLPFGVSWSHIKRHTVGLLWMTDQPVAQTSTYTGQHNRHPCPEGDSNPRPHQPNGRRPTPLTARPLGSVIQKLVLYKIGNMKPWPISITASVQYGLRNTARQRKLYARKLVHNELTAMGKKLRNNEFHLQHQHILLS
jgi:hypothetical protein